MTRSTSTRRPPRCWLAVAILAIAPAPAPADYLTFLSESGSSVYALGDASFLQASTAGRVYAGGVGTLKATTVGASLPPGDSVAIATGKAIIASQSSRIVGSAFSGPGGSTLQTTQVLGGFTAGGTLTLNSSSVSGDVVTAGAFKTSDSTVGGLVHAQTPVASPYDFGTGAAYLAALSAAQSGADDPVRASLAGYTAPSGPGTTFLTVPLSALASGATIRGDASSTLVINVVGDGNLTLVGRNLALAGGIRSDHVLYNFLGTVKFLIDGSVGGSIMAPSSSVFLVDTQSGAGHHKIDGRVVAGSFQLSYGTVTSTPFLGDLRVPLVIVPTPPSAVLLGAGLGIVGLGIWRRTRRGVGAA